LQPVQTKVVRLTFDSRLILPFGPIGILCFTNFEILLANFIVVKPIFQELIFRTELPAKFVFPRLENISSCIFLIAKAIELRHFFLFMLRIAFSPRVSLSLFPLGAPIFSIKVFFVLSHLGSKHWFNLKRLLGVRPLDRIKIVRTATMGLIFQMYVNEASFCDLVFRFAQI
jgi:hypothetical protein